MLWTDSTYCTGKGDKHIVASSYHSQAVAFSWKGSGRPYECKLTNVWTWRSPWLGCNLLNLIRHSWKGHHCSIHPYECKLTNIWTRHFLWSDYNLKSLVLYLCSNSSMLYVTVTILLYVTYKYLKMSSPCNLNHTYYIQITSNLETEIWNRNEIKTFM